MEEAEVVADMEVVVEEETVMEEAAAEVAAMEEKVAGIKTAEIMVVAVECTMVEVCYILAIFGFFNLIFVSFQRNELWWRRRIWRWK